ncbi:glycosyltransferase family 2 protein [Flavicella sediminum]|uniref:glycosyltransferase family 2 protein n=1 Tax=Flavicella sediminum TaxID=2585141 RepID=UPI00111E5164|nr:glycosyltransferase family 2 protein [Flavicella sediminum]
MSHNVLVSVSCITYNHGKFIKQCLDGFVMQQTDFNFEVLIHDDASTDDTAEIIKEYQLKYPDLIKPIFQTINQYSLGVKRFNVKFNLPRAKGKYLAMCEGDDYWTDPLKLQKQVDALENNLDCNLCVHNTNVLRGDELMKKDWRIDSSKTVFTIFDYIYSLFFHTSSVLFRIYKNQKYIENPNILQGDMAMFMSLINDKKVFFIEEEMSVYRLHEGGITNSTLHKNRTIAYKSSLLLLEEFDAFSKGKFKFPIHLKKQMVWATLVKFDKKYGKIYKSLAQVHYYAMKVLLLMYVKLKK